MTVATDRYTKQYLGGPINGNGHRKEATPGPPIVRRMFPAIKAKYDLAETADENAKHWARSDYYDSDSANTRWVRGLMVRRSRYEFENNGILDGLGKTDATFIVRTGPRLRLVSADEKELQETAPEKDKIKADWAKWCKAIQFRRKLWCMAHAKLKDGESFGLVRYNPNVAHDVKLDLVLFETEQCQTPMLPFGVLGYIDGIRFDPYGNPIYYDVLPRHPGALGLYKPINPDPIPAKYVLHWFLMERPGQHRGVPAFKSTLGLGAVHRRFRNAVVDGAETISNISLIAQTQSPPMSDDDVPTPDEFAPFSSVEWQRNMMMMAPMGWNIFQPKGEQPPATYEMYMRAHIQELARPRSMPYNIAAADSSNSSFASGKLDLFPYYMVVDSVDREDCNDLVLDKLFSLWWQEYVLVNQAQGRMWDQDPSEPPDHSWDWPRNPIADEASEARTNAEKLRTGQAAPSDIAHEGGESFEDQLRKMARDYGKTVDEIREALFQVNVAPKSGGMIQQGEPGEKSKDGKPGQQPPKNREQPEQNGKDAPTQEQMSMLVGQLTALLPQLQAIVARAT